MMLSYKGWFVFSQPLRLLVGLAGIVVAAIGNCSRRATVPLGIDTLIANILVRGEFDEAGGENDCRKLGRLDDAGIMNCDGNGRRQLLQRIVATTAGPTSR